MIDKQKKVIVVGGAGFIGRELVCQLSKLYKNIIVIDNLINGRVENLNGIANVTFIREDMRNISKIKDLIRNAEILFHLACLGVRHSIHSPKENYDVNSTGTLDLLIAAKEVGVKKFVYVSSSEVYGKHFYSPIDEEHPTYPMTIYGAGKLAAESSVRAFYTTYGYPTVIIRPFNTYGPFCHHEGDCGEVIPKFLIRSLNGEQMTIFGDGEQLRDFIYVSDTANGILLAAENDRCIGETINIGTGSAVTINYIANCISDLTGSKKNISYVDPRPGDTIELHADITKAKELFNFSPQIDLVSGLNYLKEWYSLPCHSLSSLLKEDVVYNWRG